MGVGGGKEGRKGGGRSALGVSVSIWKDQSDAQNAQKYINCTSLLPPPLDSRNCCSEVRFLFFRSFALPVLYLDSSLRDCLGLNLR